MKKAINILLIGCSLVFLSSFKINENPKNILVKLNKVYFNKSYQMDYEVSSYNYSESKSIYSYKGHVAKQGNNKYIKTGNKITLLNKKHYLYVDHDQKLMVFNTVSGLNKNQSEQDIISWIDTVLNQYEMTYKSKINGNHVIEVDTEGQSYRTVKLFIDSKTFQLKKITYLFNKGDYEFDSMSVVYTNIKVGKVINKNLFSSKPYIVSIINPKPTREYSDFEFIDQRNIKN